MIYTRPPESSKYTRHIWDQAGLSEMAADCCIKDAIDAWIVLYGNIEEDPRHINIYNIVWTSPDGVTIITSYNTFYRWILCSCTTIAVMDTPETMPFRPSTAAAP